MIRKLKIFRTVLVVIFCGLGCVATSHVTPLHPAAVIRVALMKSAPQVTLRIRGEYTISDPTTRDVLSAGRGTVRVRADTTDKKIFVGSQEFPLSRIRIEARRYIALFIDGKQRRFRGCLELIQNPDQSLLVVNHLHIEDYIRGVLYHEVSHRWPLEAIKAQAVATRTYALYHKKANAERPYDVTNDIYSQVYGGRTSEHYRTNLAVERTRDEVLVFQGELIPAYFHATCGGHTENASRLWNHAPLVPLSGVPCIYCGHSPHFFWTAVMARKDLHQELRDYGLSLQSVQDMRIIERNDSGRIAALEIIDDQNRSVTVSGKEFRSMIGPNKIKSNNYRLQFDGEQVIFTGRGWGHGVGLCQWGAQQMAAQRHDYRAILQYYYPGTQIEKQVYR